MNFLTNLSREKVLFVLRVKGELEGVGSMVLRKNAELCISVKNPLSDYEVREQL